jgi:hypothetical protein
VMVRAWRILCSHEYYVRLELWASFLRYRGGGRRSEVVQSIVRNHMVPSRGEVGAYVHAMLCVPFGNDHGHHWCGYVKGEDKCLTCNTLCIRPVGDVDVDDSVGGAVVADVGLEAVLRMEEGNRH